jgi:putative colanic acid biosysnthesis UDP-glucose lipid carrier transferase
MEDKYYSRLIKGLIFVIDFYSIQVAFSMVKVTGIVSEVSTLRYPPFLVIFSLVWIIAGFANEIHRINRRTKILIIIKDLFATITLHAIIVVSISLFMESFKFPWQFFASVYATSFLLIVGMRIVLKMVWRYVDSSGFDKRKIVIVGTTRSGKALYEFFQSHDYSAYQCKCFGDDHPNYDLVSPELVIGKCGDIQAFCKTQNISEIYFAMPLKYEKTVAALSKFADDNFIYFRIVPDFSKAVAEKYNVYLFDSVPVFTPRNEPLGISVNAGLKRAFDVLFSALVILTVYPIVVPIIALAIKLDSRGPVVFRQTRRGKKNSMFECYKFRTMKTGVDPMSQATKKDPRVTRVGRFLRKSNLDELPQFVNVLMGNMSVVGPRPHITNQDDYAKVIGKYQFRHFVTPGITGYAQVNGYRGETKEPILMEKRVEYDIKYMENWSLTLDVKIIMQTVWLMLRGQDKAY